MLKTTLNQQHIGGGVLAPRPTFTKATVVVPPGETRSLGVGVYNEGDPKPEFKYTCTPAMDEDMLGAVLDRLPMVEQLKYMLLYLFHNYGDKECKVEVERV